MSEVAVPPLGQEYGYGIVVGLGFAFGLFMIGVTWSLKRYHNEVQDSENFNTAGRTVKSGLVASAVVSSWTWAATLLQSSSVAYRYGVSGPFWYASGATVQIILFATLAIELKRKAPNAHTFLEAAKARYGPAVHGVFIVFALMTNFLVTAMLITGGSAVIQSLTGMATEASCFLIPLGVLFYTLFGGLKATLISDWVNGLATLIVIIIFAFSAYATNAQLGSPGAVWDALQEATIRHPVEGNEQGSYLTMHSQGGVIFFVINIIGNFGTVFLDNGYWNKAIAASPVHALPGYIVGGLSWFAIPWLCATTMGLAAVALEANEVFPTFPDRIPDIEVTAGLVLPYAARALLGTSGAIATLLLIFFAVTSAYSSELISVSSIWTYDIYSTYINKNPSQKQLIFMSHAGCAAFAILMSCVSIGLYHAGVGMGYIYLMMGVIISSCVIPATLTLTWKGQSRLAATLAPILGLCCSVIAWLVTASQTCGELTVECTGSNYPMLAGNVTALLSPVIWITLFTYVFGKPQDYDWMSMKIVGKIEVQRSRSMDASADAEMQSVPDACVQKDNDHLNRAAKIARWMTITMTLALLVLWPMPLFGSRYIFSREFFTGWVVVGFIWIFCSTIAVGVYPVFESRKSLFKIAKSAIMEALGKRTIQGQHQRSHGNSAEQSSLEEDVDVVVEKK